MNTIVLSAKLRAEARRARRAALKASPFANMASELQRHARRSRAELQDAEVLELRRQRATGLTLRELAEKFRLSKAGAWSICSGRTRKEKEVIS